MSPTPLHPHERQLLSSNIIIRASYPEQELCDGPVPPAARPSPTGSCATRCSTTRTVGWPATSPLRRRRTSSTQRATLPGRGSAASSRWCESRPANRRGPFGDEVTEARLRDLVEQEFEPRRFGDEDRFGYWFRLGEAWPRGQLTGILTLSQVGEPGAWWRIFNEPDLAKQDEPTVEGVDCPSLGIVQAYNDPQSAVLTVRTCAGLPSRRHSSTIWRVTNLPDPGAVTATCDEREFAGIRVVDADAVEITCDIDDHLFRLSLGRSGEPPTPEAEDQRPSAARRRASPTRAGAPAAQPGGGKLPPFSAATGRSCCRPTRSGLITASAMGSHET